MTKEEFLSMTEEEQSAVLAMADANVDKILGVGESDELADIPAESGRGWLTRKAEKIDGKLAKIKKDSSTGKKPWWKKAIMILGGVAVGGLALLGAEKSGEQKGYEKATNDALQALEESRRLAEEAATVESEFVETESND